MFNKEIDVAKIMHEIKTKVRKENMSEYFYFDKSASENQNELNKVYSEIHRINDYIENNRKEAENYSEMGRSIPVSDSRGSIVRKVLTFYKRFFRKSTRFLVLDQTEFNNRMLKCMRGVYESQQHLFTIINQVKRLEEENEKLKNELENLKSKKGSTIDDETYIKFEDQFRGSEDEIKKRLWNYVDHAIESTINDKECDKIIDLGCGRGEFLEILKCEGYNCIGIDLNEAMVNACKDKGLNAVYCDALEYLKTVEDSSVKIITAFQVIEHIDLDVLAQLIKECYRVLDVGGKIIFETPNSKNLEVGAYAFYNDPTHVRPVNQEYVEFLCKNQGYSDTEIYYWKNREIEEWINSIINSDSTNVLESPTIRMILDDLRKKLFISPDYAIIATK